MLNSYLVYSSILTAGWFYHPNLNVHSLLHYQEYFLHIAKIRINKGGKDPATARSHKHNNRTTCKSVNVTTI